MWFDSRSDNSNDDNDDDDNPGMGVPREMISLFYFPLELINL